MVESTENCEHRERTVEKVGRERCRASRNRCRRLDLFLSKESCQELSSSFDEQTLVFVQLRYQTLVRRGVKDFVDDREKEEVVGMLSREEVSRKRLIWRKRRTAAVVESHRQLSTGKVAFGKLYPQIQVDV